MPIYEYRCLSCENAFDAFLPLSQYADPQVCPACGSEEAAKVLTTVGFILKGDGWTGKNLKIRRQMEEKNRRLLSRQEEMKREAPSVCLSPNVNGERVSSWSEAQKLAVAKGKDAATYEPMIKREKKLLKKSEVV